MIVFSFYWANIVINLMIASVILIVSILWFLHIKKKKKYREILALLLITEGIDIIPEKEYPPAIEDILLFIYRRTGRFKCQTTYSYLKVKITSYRDEEVKNGINWLKKHKNYVEEISTTSIKMNDSGINLLKSLNKIK